MTDGDVGAAVLRRLLAEIRADRRALAERQEELDTLLVPGGEPAERASATALTIDRSYTTLEAMLERVSRTLEGGPPRDEERHRSLLAGASLAVEKVRPPVLRPETVEAANEIRRFRHFLRHAYTERLRPDRVLELARRWRTGLSLIEADLDGFERFLEELADRVGHRE